MRKENLIRIENKKYPIFVGMGILGQICKFLPLERYSQIAVLSDENVAPHWLSKLDNEFSRGAVQIIVPNGEQSKSVRQAEKIWIEMLKANLDRHSLLVNLGGGVIGDLGGFVASTFMRSIDFLQIPTSLLAMVDSGVGGKTGINVGGIKNSVGVFKDPIGVVIDIDTLETLPKRELISGFAEIIKHGIITDRKHFDLAVSQKPEEFSKEELMKLIADSIRIKLTIVQKDPREKSLRKILNFGHTIGHAIESLSLLSDNLLLHGEAIAIGMVAESKLAQLLGLLSEEDFEVIENSINNIGLPIRTGLSKEEIRKLIINDKKNVGKKVLWSLPGKVGLVKFDIEVPDELVVKAIEYIKI